MTDLGSRSDLETLRRSGRGKFVLLGVLIAAALGAAAYSFTRKSGTGNPEEAGRVFVVTQGTTIGYSVVLQEAGFEAREGTLAALENKAKDEVPDLDGRTGLAAVLALADRFGWGYVAIENPGSVDFSGLDIDAPSFTADTRWAVLSVGDFAFPHRLTVNPAPSKVLRDPGLPLLGALFEQDKLKVLRTPDKLAVSELQLRDRMKEGLQMLDRIPEAERLAEKIVAGVREIVIDGEQADPKPVLVGDPLESGEVHPLPDGRVMSVTRGIEVVTRDAIRGDLVLGAEQRFWAGAAAGDPAARTPCASLAGGQVGISELASEAWSDDGQAVVLELLAEGESVWRWDAAAAKADPSGCAFVKLGLLAKPRPDQSGELAVWRTGKVARLGSPEGMSVLSVRTAGGDEDELGLLADTPMHGLVWLDDDHLAAIAVRGPEAANWILLFSLTEPLKVLAIPATALAGATSITHLAAVPGKPQIVAVIHDGEEHLARLDLPASLAELFAAPPVDPSHAPVEIPGRPTVIDLDPSRFTTTALAGRGSIRTPIVAPDGTQVVFGLSGEVVATDGTHDEEIAIADLGGKGMKVLTRNELADRDPRFTSDGAFVVFHTRVEIPKTDWVITAPRVLALR